MSNKSRGTARELQLVKRLRADGWLAFRAPASLGVADVIALKDGERSLLIELKANRRGGPFMNFRRDDRLALSAAAHRAGADAFLVHWPPHGRLTWIAEEGWPELRSVLA